MPEISFIANHWYELTSPYHGTIFNFRNSIDNSIKPDFPPHFLNVDRTVKLVSEVHDRTVKLVSEVSRHV